MPQNMLSTMHITFYQVTRDTTLPHKCEIVMYALFGDYTRWDR